jgi:hypothetical protein
LYAYGNTDRGANASEIRQVLPFTTDLDLLSEHLCSLRTSGGDENCGEVIRDATTQLAWSKAPDAMRLIFIAGNEPFTQGPVDFHDSVKAARERGITVNTLHCGGYEEGICPGRDVGVGLGMRTTAGLLRADWRNSVLLSASVERATRGPRRFSGKSTNAAPSCTPRRPT